MLDAEASWTAIVHRHAPADVAARLTDNEFFLAIARHFPASYAYAAAEEMANFLDARVWDLVVVDTPPASGGIGFFTAPADMKDLVGGRLLRWLTGARLPGRKAMYALTGRPALRIAGAVLGTDLLERVAEFLIDLRTTYDGLARRSKEIERHFKASRTIVVTTADPTPVREAARFFRELPESAPSPSAVVFNRTLPVAWEEAGPLEPNDTTLADLRALENNLGRWAADARQQEETRIAFSDRYRAPLATISWQPQAPTDVAALTAMLESAKGLDVAELIGG
jgi:anion-transporting  ArsA/GET3 family ATPase